MGEHLHPCFRTFTFSELGQMCGQIGAEWGGQAAPVVCGCMGLLPSRLHGFRLKRALSRLWASVLRNCGMPSLALKNRVVVWGGQDDQSFLQRFGVLLGQHQQVNQINLTQSSRAQTFGLRALLHFRRHRGHQRASVYMGSMGEIFIIAI